MLKSFVIKLILLFVFKVAICKANYAIRRIDISEPEEGSPNRVGVVNGARPCGKLPNLHDLHLYKDYKTAKNIS